MKKNIMVTLVLTIVCFTLCGCFKPKIDLSEVEVSDFRTYSMQILSTNADDVDLCLYIGYGVGIEGTKGAYALTNEYGTAIIQSNGYTHSVEEGESVELSDDIKNTLIDFIDNTMTVCKQSIPEISIDKIDDVKYYVLDYIIDVDDSNINKVTLYVDREDKMLTDAIVVLDEGLTVRLGAEDTIGLAGSSHFITKEEAISKLVRSFKEDNVYIVGKYDFVDLIVEEYSEWLGETL